MLFVLASVPEPFQNSEKRGLHPVEPLRDDYLGGQELQPLHGIADDTPLPRPFLERKRAELRVEQTRL